MSSCAAAEAEMANFCPGDFSSFPGGESSSFRRGRGRQRYASSTAAGTRKASRGSTKTAPLGVSQWGRQQLSYPGPAGSHASESSTAVQPCIGGGKKHQGRGRGRAGGGGGGGGGGCWGEPDTSQPIRMTIQDLSPHMANSVSFYNSAM